MTIGYMISHSMQYVSNLRHQAETKKIAWNHESKYCAEIQNRSWLDNHEIFKKTGII